jgi:outer membrane receptor protein involved in Fe transport
MNVTILRSKLLASTVLVGAALAAAPAMAQTSPTVDGSTVPAGEQVDTGNQPNSAGDEVVVTGSRIANPNLTSTSPLTVISGQEAKLQGTTRVEDLVNSLPQVFGNQGGGVSNGSTGTATIDLRGIGPSRTLVLLNGRRLVPGDPRAPFADLNTIPAGLIERVEVLSGGASSVYGSDAVAGVVNFVLDTDFQGFRVDTQYGIFNHQNDGDDRVRGALAARNFPTPSGNTTVGMQFDSSLTFGAASADGRGQLTAYVGYRQIEGVTQDQFDYSACALAASTTTDTFTCSGSGTTAPAQIQPFRNNFTASGPLTLDPAAPNGAGFRPYVGARDAFNFAPFNYFQRPDKRFTAGAFGKYEISEALEPYFEFNFMDDRTIAQIAPSGAFGVQYSIPCDGSNPLISASQLSALCTPARTAAIPDNPATAADESDPAQTSVTAFLLRRNVEGGGRQDDLRHTTYRIVAGLRGDLGGGFQYDAFGQFGRSIFSQTYLNEFSITRTNRALNVVNVNGTPTCQSVVDGSDPNCVPYNIYTLNGVTPEALNYLQTPGFSNGQTTEQIASASISNSNLFALPFATNGVGFAVGAEYRKESIEYRTDTAFTTGDLAGQGGPSIGLTGEPSFDVKELFGELRIPLVEDKPFFRSLSLELGYRYSDYSSAGTTDAYKIQGDWAPIEGVRFRGGYNRAVRAPNIVELFTPQGNSLFAGTDPCSGASPSFTLAQCQNTGVSAAQYGSVPENPAAQFQQLTGGNPNLTPETSDTYTAGVVIAPRGGFLRGLSVSVDYFDIEVRDLISTVGSQIILNQCGQTGDATLCDLINRDATGSLFLSPAGVITNTNVNIGGLRTQGIDVAADYRFDLGDVGGLSFAFVGTYLDRYTIQPGTVDAATGIDEYSCRGQFGVTCGVPLPKWRHKLRTTFSPGNVLSLSVNWRYIGAVTDEQQSDNPFLTGGDYIPNRRLRAANYFDLAALISATDDVDFRIGVNNVFDRDPPVIGQASLSGTFGNGNTYPQIYDALGRFFYAGATLSF